MGEETTFEIGEEVQVIMDSELLDGKVTHILHDVEEPTPHVLLYRVEALDGSWMTYEEYQRIAKKPIPS